MLFTVGCRNTENVENNENKTNATSSATKDNKEKALLEDESYYSKDDVVEYLHQYGKLPKNYITKKEAKEINWSVKDRRGLVIGGDRFGNREERLPKVKGKKYYEADISEGYSHNRGAMRIIYSDDGFIYYTDDHYETFERLYWAGDCMKRYIIDGNEFVTRESGYNHLTKVFGFSESFGNNLDALWDELTELEDVEIVIENAREIPRLLEDYGLKILDVFGDLYDEGIELKIYW